MTFDALNRPTLLNAPSGTMDIATTYDNVGRVLTRSGNGQTLTTTWDALSRMTSEVGPLGTMAYQYDLAGRRTRLTWPDSTYFSYEHNLYNELTAIKNSGGTTLVGYGYNNLGQQTSISRATGGSTSRGYDSWYRLTSLAHDLTGSSADVTLSFTYNPAGQIRQRTVSNPAYVFAPVTGTDGYSVNGRNQYTAIDGTTPTYDADQNTTSVQGQNFGYDALNQLTSAGSTTFSFDPAQRLYRSVGSADNRFVYDGEVAAAEYNSAGSLTRRHVPGTRLETALTYDSSVTQYLITDERGSVIALADGSGVTVNSYDEYGAPDPGNVGRFQYTGQMWLPEAGLYHYRARGYLPSIGRFLQTDPIGYVGGANLYAYVTGDPINLADPWGLQEQEPGTWVEPVDVVGFRCPSGATCVTGDANIRALLDSIAELGDVVVSGGRSRRRPNQSSGNLLDLDTLQCAVSNNESGGIAVALIAGGAAVAAGSPIFPKEWMRHIFPNQYDGRLGLNRGGPSGSRTSVISALSRGFMGGGSSSGRAVGGRVVGRVGSRIFVVVGVVLEGAALAELYRDYRACQN